MSPFKVDFTGMACQPVRPDVQKVARENLAGPATAPSGDGQGSVHLAPGSRVR